MDKIPGTNLDEQYVAFSLIDLETFISNLLHAGLINNNEYDNVHSLLLNVEQRCGFNQGDDKHE